MKIKFLSSVSLLIIWLTSCAQNTLIEVQRFPVKDKVVQTGLYKGLDGVYHFLNGIKAKYPQKVKLFVVGKSARFGRPIPLLRISFNANNSQKRFLFAAGIHGDEAAAVEGLLYAIERLSEKSAQESSLSASADFIPLQNPDGYAENRRENGSGIDLNRNFPVGRTVKKMEPETKAMAGLINETAYDASLFFHSANETKYENVIRRPLEFEKYGASALQADINKALDNLAKIVKKAGNDLKPDISWEIHSDMVDKEGISSDWCVSGALADDKKELVWEKCINPHPSLTIELCCPKQPVDRNKLQQEKEETFQIIQSVLE